jgi:hypothetical protein
VATVLSQLDLQTCVSIFRKLEDLEHCTSSYIKTIRMRCECMREEGENVNQS